MTEKIDIWNVVNEIENSSNDWNKEEGFICIEKSTPSYLISLCYQESTNEVSYFIYEGNLKLEDYCTEDKNPTLFEKLLYIYNTANINIVSYA